MTALSLALLPAAAALGVLVGKHNSGSDKDLIAALRAAPRGGRRRHDGRPPPRRR